MLMRKNWFEACSWWYYFS